MSTVSDDGVDVTVVQAAGDDVFVAFLHIHAAVTVGTSEDHRQEGLLPGSLFVHVHVVTESIDAIITQYLAIEDVNGLVHGGFTAQIFRKCAH